MYRLNWEVKLLFFGTILKVKGHNLYTSKATTLAGVFRIH